MSETVGPTRRAKRLLSAEQKYQIWLKILTGEVTTNEAAARAGVDRSTMLKLRKVAKKSVEASMARQGLQRRSRRRRRGLTRPDRSADAVPDLLGRDFTAEGPDQKWCGDFKQVNTAEGPVSSRPSRTCTRGACWASRPPTPTPQPISPPRRSTWPRPQQAATSPV